MRNYHEHSTAAMMDSLSCHHPSGSPNSSEDIESHHGTPETKLTAFSPEDVRLQPRVGEYKTVRSNLPPAFALGQPQDHSGSTVGAGNTLAFSCQDPFITNSSASYRTSSPRPQPKLSAGASSFTPLGTREHGSSPAMNCKWEPAVTNPQYHNGISKFGYLPKTSNYNTPIKDSKSEQLRLSNSPTGQSVSVSPNIALKIEVVPVKMGYFSSDGETSRSLIISEISPRTSPKEVDDFFSVRYHQAEWDRELRLISWIFSPH